MSQYESQFFKLSDVGTVARGKSKHRPRNDPSLYGGKYPFIQTGDVKRSNFYITDYSQTYNERGLTQSKLWYPGTLCITIAANIADTAILKIPACFPDSIIGFIPNNDKSDVHFVKYCLDTYKLQIQSISQGTTQDNLSLEKLLSIKLRIPPLHVQRKIAAVLSAYDDLIENNDRRIALLEKMAEETYREWFVRLRFPGHEQDIPLEVISEKNENITLNEICELIIDCEHKTAPLQDTGYPSIRTPNIGKGRLLLNNVNRVSEQTYNLWTKRAIPQSGDLVLAREAPVGNVAIIPNNLKVCLGQRITLIRPNKKKIRPYYLLLLLLRPETQYNLLGLSNGATVHHLNMKDIRNLKLPPIHPLEIQEQFNSIVATQYNLLFTLTEQTQNLRQTRDRLLTRLISGKLSVEDLDIQFPPSMKEDRPV